MVKKREKIMTKQTEKTTKQTQIAQNGTVYIPKPATRGVNIS